MLSRVIHAARVLTPATRVRAKIAAIALPPRLAHLGASVSQFHTSILGNSPGQEHTSSTRNVLLSNPGMNRNTVQSTKSGLWDVHPTWQMQALTSRHRFLSTERRNDARSRQGDDIFNDPHPRHGGSWNEDHIERPSRLPREQQWPYRRVKERRPLFQQEWFRALLILGAATAGIAAFTAQRNEISGNYHLDISASIEDTLGQAIADGMKSEAALLPPDHADSLLVRVLGEAIAEASGVDLNWEYNVVESTEVNAVCLPGGKIFVFTGLLRELNDIDMVAQVMAHEIGHALCHHSAEQIIENVLVLIGSWLALGNNDNTFVALMRQLLTLPFSRAAEHEADLMGIVLMSRACFDYKAAPKVFQKFAQLHEAAGTDQSTMGEYFSTHPLDASREERMVALQRRAKEEFRRAKCNSNKDGYCWTRKRIQQEMRKLKARVHLEEKEKARLAAAEQAGA